MTTNMHLFPNFTQQYNQQVSEITSILNMTTMLYIHFQMVHWQLEQNHLPTSEQLSTVLQCFSLTLQTPNLSAVYAEQGQTTWVCTAIRATHQILSSCKSIQTWKNTDYRYIFHSFVQNCYRTTTLPFLSMNNKVAPHNVWNLSISL